MSGVPAEEYHERTKHRPDDMGGVGLDFDNKPTPYKVYEELPSLSMGRQIRPPQQPALAAIAETESSPTDSGGTGQVNLETLTALCYYTAGITRRVQRRGREFRFRAAACTGALYHIDLYPVVGDLPGLDAGVYHFDPRTLSLDVLRDGDYRGILAAAAQESGVREAPVTFIATSTWWRNAWKYGERTYRHAFWDSGTILSNLLAIAHSIDLPARVVTGFADSPIADLLGIDPEWEAPLELVPVGAGNPVPDAPAVEPLTASTEPLSPDPQTPSLIYEAWRASVLPDGAAAANWRDGGDRQKQSNRPATESAIGDGNMVELDPVGPERASNRPLHRTIRRRGSCREYRREDVSFRKVSTVVDRAVRGTPMDVRRREGSPLQYVDCFCIVNGVNGIESGAYQYHPDAGVLERLRTGDYRREAGHLALDQRLGADAAVCLYFLADIGDVCTMFGNRGYRLAQLESALAAGRLYLATYAHRDLGGTGLTFYDDEVTAFFEPRAGDQTPMFLYTLGRPT